MLGGRGRRRGGRRGFARIPRGVSGAAFEPKAMGSQLVSHANDPPTTRITSLVQRKYGRTHAAGTSPIVLTIGGVGTGVLGGIPGSSWSSVRFLKITVWAPDATNPPSSTLTVTDMLSGGDGISFNDCGTAGQSRACVAYRPAFSARQVWHTTSTDTVASVAFTPAAATDVVYTEVSVEINLIG